MKLRISHTVAALLAAGAISVANAATAPTTSYVSEPIASAFTTNGGAVDATVNAVIEALNADTSLQRSKISVGLDEMGNILLTGASDTQEQAEQAAKVAAGTQSGIVQVINAIQPEKINYRTWSVVSG